MYKKIGNIDCFEDIPWGEEIIVTGSIKGNCAWCQRMPGVFKNDNGNFRFLDEYGMSTYFVPGDPISFNILEEIQ